MFSMVIIIDSREKFKNRLKKELHGSEIRKLDHGDYLVDGKLLVERKAFSDLVSTFGRLHERFPAMLLHCKAGNLTPCLLIEGPQKWHRSGRAIVGRGRQLRVTRSQVRHYLISLALKNVIIIYTDSLTDTIRFLNGVAKYMGEANIMDYSMNMNDDNMMAAFWLSHDGIGKNTAKILAEYSFEELIGMSKEALSHTTGTKTRGKIIYKILRGDWHGRN